MMAARKPMTFDMERPALAPAAPSVGGTSPEARKSVGARVTVSVYRQLKAHAALTGLKVQDLVEEAIREKLDQLGKTA